MTTPADRPVYSDDDLWVVTVEPKNRRDPEKSIKPSAHGPFVGRMAAVEWCIWLRGQTRDLDLFTNANSCDRRPRKRSGTYGCAPTSTTPGPARRTMGRQRSEGEDGPTGEEIERLSAQAEAGYSPDQLQARPPRGIELSQDQRARLSDDARTNFLAEVPVATGPTAEDVYGALMATLAPLREEMEQALVARSWPDDDPEARERYEAAVHRHDGALVMLHSAQAVIRGTTDRDYRAPGTP